MGEPADYVPQAIHNLQNEVIQLRQHLESSLRQSPTQRKLGKPATLQHQRDDRAHQFSQGFHSPRSRLRDPPNDSAAEDQWRSSVSHDHDPLQQSTQKGRVRGAYTGTQYPFSDSQPVHAADPVNVPRCLRCQDYQRKKHVTMKTSTDDESPAPTHPPCPLCHGKRGADNMRHNKASHGENSRHHRRRSHSQHWFMSQPPPVSCIYSPLVPYSQVVYSSPPGVYVAAGYQVADLRSSFVPPPSPDTLLVEDLSYPLNRALKAAKELKVTSKRMCRSLTMDLSAQRSLRSSCLF